MGVPSRGIYHRQTTAEGATVAPRDYGWQALGPASAFTGLAIVILSLRWYTRVVLVRQVGPEDFVVSAAMVLSVALLVCTGFQLQNDTTQLSYSPSTIGKLTIAGAILYHTATNLTRASIVTQYLHIFKDRSFTLLRRLCYCLYALILGAFLYGCISGLVLCIPMKKWWEPWTPGKCGNLLVQLESTSIIHIGLDVIIWCIPIPVLSHLRLPRRQRFALALVFLLGGMTCVFGLLRLTLTVHYASEQKFNELKVNVTLWTCLETNGGIICASLIYTKPLIMKLFPRVLSSRTPAQDNMRLPEISSTSTEGEKGSKNLDSSIHQ